jgi:acyl-CoA reductase-like NAD-dependent aldehyde dehydrogenase
VLLEDVMAYKLLINGKLVDGAKTLEVFNPATGGVLAICPRADEAQLDEAVAAAKAAFPAWSALSFSERRVKLEAIADALEARTDEFARLLTQEQGKPTAQATGEVMGAVVGMRAFAALRSRPRSSVKPIGSGSSSSAHPLAWSGPSCRGTIRCCSW